MSIAAAFVISACDSHMDPAPLKISVCHLSGAVGTLTDVPLTELASHLAHGDYVARLSVGKSQVASMDSVHFRRIGDALAVVRAGRLARGETQTAACPITIAVDTGVFLGSLDQQRAGDVDQWPLVIDVPSVSVRGSFTMQVDAEGRATGAGKGSTATILAPVTPLGDESTMIIVNAHPQGSSGHGATIEGFVFLCGDADPDVSGAGLTVFSMRVRDLVIRGNRLGPGCLQGMDLRATSATIDGVV